MTWTGPVLSALFVLLMLFSAVMKLTTQPPVIEMLVGTFGYQESAIVWIGVVELLCALLYAVPRTSVLGAVLCTGYIGGAVAAHVRIDDPFIAALLIGVVPWAGLYLRDHRLRALMPLVGPAPKP